KATAIRSDIVEEMQKYSKNLEFEKASIYRDRLEALSHIQNEQHISSNTIEEADIFAIYQNGSMACIEVFFFRLGQNWG
ncbi:UvrB/UvrC motif-containing protein, partial [Escherichia coli]|uniref:UvrB/UvrC motif-containing protein n=1 Tax=Escherichia coli TaxID=562 RepID=UPI001F274601